MATTPGTTDYAAIQDNEIQVLESIFGEDFVEEAIKTTAWNKKSERAFKLTLKPPSFQETGLSVVLHVRLPNTYPKSAPICSTKYSDLVPVKTQKAVESTIKSKIKSMLGHEMIYELADCIQTDLDSAASKIKDAEDIPTLLEERAAQQAEAKQLEEQLVTERLERERSAQDEEQQNLDRMLDDLKQKERIHHKPKPSSYAESAIADGLSFDNEIKIKDRDGIVRQFSKVANKTKYRVGPVTTLYSAISAELGTISANYTNGAHTANGVYVTHDAEPLPFLIVKECLASSAAYAPNKLNQAIETLEADLRALQDLQPHPGICNPLAFKFEKTSKAWNIVVLVPFHERGSLHDLIETLGPLDAKHIRSWTIQLLEALDFLHRHRIVHGRISARNILLARTDTGATVIKFCDVLFQHGLHMLQNVSAKFSSASSAYWHAPESANKDTQPTATKDIWDLGVVLLQMAFGINVQQEFNSPTALIEGNSLSESFEDLLALFFKADPKKRPTAFNLMTNEFLRSNKPVLHDPDGEELSRTTSLVSTPKTPKLKHDIHQSNAMLSRYTNDFVEQGRLGKGGFGEVVKARNKLDGNTYAIKKITQTTRTALSNVLSEVMLLSRLNNPYIVRYYNAWIEEQDIVGRGSFSSQLAGESDEEDDSISESSSDIFAASSQLPTSTRKGLDFVDSQPGFEFGYDTDDEEAIAATDDETDSETEDNTHSEDESSRAMANRRRRSSIIRTKVTLYIQMEYCERQTLRDVIRDNLHTKDEECWRLFRQILEGLVYVHSHGVIHRDLKPENIFISQDQSNTVRIGDFGLARAGEATNKVQGRNFADPRLTASIGTSIYVAPEVKSSGGGSYNDKADMYSLGIMLFEMGYPVKTGMERAKILNDLREKDSKLPPDFGKPLNAEIIMELVKHKVSERPSSQELLRSGKLPSHVEDETIRSALRSLADKKSPFYTRFIQGLFAQGVSDSSLDYAYDLDTGLKYNSPEQMISSWIQEQLMVVFRRHGAVKMQRSKLIPHIPEYYAESAAQLLDQSGNVVQLPFDLTLPFARMLAKMDISTIARKSFTFGSVFRANPSGFHPRMLGEVDFDIVSDNSLDLALREAEVIKVLDEIIESIPPLAEFNISYQIGHSRILDTILNFCKVPKDKTPQVKQIISKLNIGANNWARIKTELRAPEVAISSTCLEELSRFNFRDGYSEAIAKLRSILPEVEELASTFRHLDAVVTYLERFRVKRPVFITPLASFNDKFYHGNVLFQCIYRITKKKKVVHEVLAAGGRYDKLIQDLRSGVKSGAKHAVGFNLGWKSVMDAMIAYQQASDSGKAFLKRSDDSTKVKHRRCDVLVDSVDPAMLRNNGIKIVQDLWASNISAELVIDSDVSESKGHHQQSRDDLADHDWVILIKQDDTLKVRSMITKEDTEIRISELVSWMRGELRERERLDGEKKKPLLKKEISEGFNRDADITVLVAENKSKKANRRHVIEDAQAKTSELSQAFLDCSIAAIELKDDLFEGIRDTRLSDPDSWRRYIQSAPLADRQYLSQVHELLRSKAEEASDSKSSRGCWVYNFRSRACFLYDLGRVAEK